MPATPRIVFFDCAQTLLADEFRRPVEAVAAMLRLAGAEGVPPEEVCRLTEELRAELRGGGDIEIPNRVLWHYAAGYFGFVLPRDMLPLELAYYHTGCDIRPAAGAAEMLDTLKGRGIRCAVVSNNENSGEMLRIILREQLGREPFDFVISSADYMFRKPSRRLFELAIRRAGVPAAQIWHCGDNPVNDVAAAAECGIYPVWYRGVRPGSRAPACAEYASIGSWQELLGRL